MLDSTVTKKLSVATPVAIFIALATGNAAQAVGFQIGDVFAATGSGQVQQYRSGALIDTLSTGRGGFTTGMAFDSAGSLYVTNFSDGSISKFDNNGASLGTFATGINSAPESLVFDKSGNLYNGAAGGDLDIRKFDSTGTLLQQYNVATESRGSDWIDLSADQKTMYYTSEGRQIKRFDVSTNTQLSDFANLGGGTDSFALRLLGDGGLLVADSSNIKRLDSAGNIIKTYDSTGQNSWFALNLDADGTSFWSGDFGNGKLFKFDIASGNELASISTGSSQLFGVAVFGEITQGNGNGNGKGVPEPFTIVGTLVGGTAALRMRKKLSSANKA